MSLLCRALLPVALVIVGAFAYPSAPPLRVCTDANNLPFSNLQQQGFENDIARLIGRELQRPIEFVWLPQQERYIEKNVRAGMCDVMMGTTGDPDLLEPTIPYYRSTYVFVSRADRRIQLTSLADRRVAKYKIGALLIGDDSVAVPPAEELANRGFLRNIKGYTLYGHPLDNPSADLMHGVENGEVDLAVAWGPAAGYFALQSSVPLQLTPICQLNDAKALSTTFAISMGVPKNEDALREQLNQIIKKRAGEIHAILTRFGVPLVEGTNSCRVSR